MKPRSLALLLIALTGCHLHTATPADLRADCQESHEYAWLLTDAEELREKAKVYEAKAARYHDRLEEDSEASQLAGGGGQDHAYKSAVRLIRVEKTAASYRERAAARDQEAEAFLAKCVRDASD